MASYLFSFTSGTDLTDVSPYLFINFPYLKLLESLHVGRIPFFPHFTVNLLLVTNQVGEVGG